MYKFKCFERISRGIKNVNKSTYRHTYTYCCYSLKGVFLSNSHGIYCMEFLITLSYNAVFSRLPGVLSGALKTIVFSKIQSHFLFWLKGKNYVLIWHRILIFLRKKRRSHDLRFAPIKETLHPGSVSFYVPIYIIFQFALSAAEARAAEASSHSAGASAHLAAHHTAAHHLV